MFDKPTRLDKKFLPVALNQRVACIRIKDSTALDKSFLFDFLNSDSFEQKCILSSKGVAQKNMSTEWLKDYKIPLPPLDEQCKIAAVLDKVSDLIAKRRQQLNKLDELVKSRFVEMFGDLKINEKSWKTKTFDEMSDLITDGEHATPRRKTEGIYLLSARNVLNHSLQLEDVDYIDQEEYDRISTGFVKKSV